jgi:hypothetical protein
MVKRFLWMNFWASLALMTLLHGLLTGKGREQAQIHQALNPVELD